MTHSAVVSLTGEVRAGVNRWAELMQLDLLESGPKGREWEWEPVNRFEPDFDQLVL
jgi:hypothetical protein